MLISMNANIMKTKFSLNFIKFVLRGHSRSHKVTFTFENPLFNKFFYKNLGECFNYNLEERLRDLF